MLYWGPNGDARQEFELSVLTAIPERADVGDVTESERGTSETPPKPLRRREGHRAAINGLKDYYHEHVKGKSERASEEQARPRTFP